MGKFNKINSAGNYALNPNLHHTHRWQQLSKKFKQAKCGLCANPFHLHDELRYCDEVHHILPQEHYPEYFFYWSNLVCLCADCHKFAHRLYEDENSLYFKIFANQLDKISEVAKKFKHDGGSKNRKTKKENTTVAPVKSNIFSIFCKGGVKIENGILKI